MRSAGAARRVKVHRDWFLLRNFVLPPPRPQKRITHIHNIVIQGARSPKLVLGLNARGWKIVASHQWRKCNQFVVRVGAEMVRRTDAASLKVLQFFFNLNLERCQNFMIAKIIISCIKVMQLWKMYIGTIIFRSIILSNNDNFQLRLTCKIYQAAVLIWKGLIKFFPDVHIQYICNIKSIKPIQLLKYILTLCLIQVCVGI